MAQPSSITITQGSRSITIPAGPLDPETLKKLKKELSIESESDDLLRLELIVLDKMRQVMPHLFQKSKSRYEEVLQEAKRRGWKLNFLDQEE